MMNENYQRVKIIKAKKGSKRFYVLIIIFVILLLGIGVVAFEYLKNKTIVCSEISEYYD